MYLCVHVRAARMKQLMQSRRHGLDNKVRECNIIQPIRITKLIYTWNTCRAIELNVIKANWKCACLQLFDLMEFNVCMYACARGAHLV